MWLGILDIPELADLSPLLRRRIFLRFLKRKGTLIAVAGLVCLVILAELVDVLLTAIAATQRTGGSAVAMFVAAVVVAIVGGVLYFSWRELRRSFRDWLRLCIENSPAQGRFVICIKCAYLLTGTNGSQCPECGAKITAGEENDAEEMNAQ